MQTYIDCLHMKKTSKSRMQADDPTEVENGFNRNEDFTFDEQMVYRFFFFPLDDRLFAFTAICKNSSPDNVGGEIKRFI